VAEVWIPVLLRRFAGEQTRVKVAGRTLRQVIDSLDMEFPGIKEHLLLDDEIMPGIAVVVDGEVADGLLEPVKETSEVHFLPAIGGGRAS
jgi:molybdopterin converting factor small subunit